MGIADAGKRAVRLAELNVQAGVQALLGSFVVDEAIRERGLEVHGTVYEIGTGKVRDLGCGTRARKVSSGVGKSGASSGNGGVDNDGVGEEGSIVTGKHGTMVFREGGASMKAVL